MTRNLVERKKKKTKLTSSNATADRAAGEVELNIHVFTETRRIIISQCFRVAESYI